MMIFPLPAGNSRRRRRLKNPGAPAPGFLRVWGRHPPTSRAPGIYRRIACYNGEGPNRGGNFLLCTAHT